MGVAEEAAGADDRARRFLRLEVGQVVGFNGALIRVNINGSAIDIPNIGLDRPLLNDSVRVLVNALGQFVVLGTVQPRASVGTISSVVAGVSVNVLGTDQITYGPLPYLLSYNPAIGNLVAIDWRQGGLVLGRMPALAGQGDPSLQPTPPPPPPTGGTGTFEFEAIDSGSFRNGGWAEQNVYYGSSYPAGAWFYGTSPYDSLVGSTVTAAEIYLPTIDVGGSTFRIGSHTAPTKPAGALTISSLRDLAGVVKGGAWYRLDVDLAQYLVNTRGAGLGTSGAGYRLFTGRNRNGDSGKIRISYRR